MRKSHFSCLVFVLVLAFSPVAAQQSDSSKNTARAIALYRQGNTAEAIKLLAEIVEEYPRDAEAWYYLGSAYYSLGQIGLSRSPFEHFVNLRPDSADGHAKLAYALILANETERALAMGRRAIKFGDSSAESHYAIAEATLRLYSVPPKTEALLLAVQEAETTLQIKPDFSLAYITKGLAHFYLEQYAEAAGAFASFVANHPHNDDAEIWRDQIGEVQRRTVMTGMIQPPLETAKTVDQKIRILSKPEPVYTEAGRLAAVQGPVFLRAVFTAEGEVKHILITRALPFGLTTQCVNAVRKIKFVPAVKNNKPVSVVLQLEYHFNLF